MKTDLTCIFFFCVSDLLLITRKSIRISIYHNFHRLVFESCFLSAALAAPGTFHRSIFTGTTRGFSGPFADPRILTGTGLCGTKDLLQSLPLDSRSSKGQLEMLLRLVPRSFSRVLQQANRIYLRMVMFFLQPVHPHLPHDPFPTLRSLELPSPVTLFQSPAADTKTKKKKKGAQRIMVGRDALKAECHLLARKGNLKSRPTNP